jgi:hypothetical protein
MHGGDDTNLQMALMNLAFVRGTFGGANDDRDIRSRIAFLLWMPGFLLILMFGVWIQSWLVIAVAMPLLLITLWVFIAGNESARPAGETYRTRSAARP